MAAKQKNNRCNVASKHPVLKFIKLASNIIFGKVGLMEEDECPLNVICLFCVQNKTLTSDDLMYKYCTFVQNTVP